MRPGYQVIELDTVESTMVEAAVRLDAGQIKPWGAVLARHQSAGRGRLQRTWADQPGDSLLATVVATVAMPADRVGLIALAAGVAVARALTQWGLEIDLKWPNDVMVGDKKLGGILIQTRLTEPITTLTGIGLNIRSVPVGQGDGAISLADLVETAPSPIQLLEAILPELEACYLKLANGDWGWIQSEWTSRALWIDQAVTVLADRELIGTFTGIDEFGRLEMVSAEGRHEVSSGDLVRGPRRLA